MRKPTRVITKLVLGATSFAYLIHGAPKANHGLRGGKHWKGYENPLWAWEFGMADPIEHPILVINYRDEDCVDSYEYEEFYIAHSVNKEWECTSYPGSRENYPEDGDPAYCYYHMTADMSADDCNDGTVLQTEGFCGEGANQCSQAVAENHYPDEFVIGECMTKDPNGDGSYLYYEKVLCADEEWWANEENRLWWYPIHDSDYYHSEYEYQLDRSKGEMCAHGHRPLGVAPSCDCWDYDKDKHVGMAYWHSNWACDDTKQMMEWVSWETGKCLTQYGDRPYWWVKVECDASDSSTYIISWYDDDKECENNGKLMQDDYGEDMYWEVTKYYDWDAEEDAWTDLNTCQEGWYGSWVYYCKGHDWPRAEVCDATTTTTTSTTTELGQVSAGDDSTDTSVDTGTTEEVAVEEVDVAQSNANNKWSFNVLIVTMMSAVAYLATMQ